MNNMKKLNKGQNLKKNRAKAVSKSSSRGGQSQKSAQKQLDHLREKIDHVDKILIQALADRMNVAEKIGVLKKKEGLPIVQPSRWHTLMAERLALATRFDLDLALIDKIFRLIHQESIKIQMELGKK